LTLDNLSHEDELEAEFNKRMRKLLNITEEVKARTQSNRLEFGAGDENEQEQCNQCF
jgi:hypothetical protein